MGGGQAAFPPSIHGLPLSSPRMLLPPPRYTTRKGEGEGEGAGGILFVCLPPVCTYTTAGGGSRKGRARPPALKRPLAFSMPPSAFSRVTQRLGDRGAFCGPDGVGQRRFNVGPKKGKKKKKRAKEPLARGVGGEIKEGRRQP